MEIALATLFEAIAAEVPERECIVHGARRLSYREVDARTDRLARYLVSRGIGLQRERGENLAGWESGQDHVALYMHNRPEYLEGMLACFKARAVPFNVNYRYVDAELIELLRDARARAIVYDAAFAKTVQRLRAHLPQLEVLIEVLIEVAAPAAERSQPDAAQPVLQDAIGYESALASAAEGAGAADARLPSVSPDDLYMLYTGGTTGKPKGVLWRQADIYMAALGGKNSRGEEVASLDAVRERARQPPARVLPSPPMMHGAAHWVAFNTLHAGGTVVIQPSGLFDARDVLRAIEHERVQRLVIVGDAFGRPLLDELAKNSYDMSSLTLLLNGGATLSAELKRAFMQRIPQLSIVDTIGSSESGQQGVNVSEASQPGQQIQAQTGRFAMARSSRVLSADLSRVLEAGHESGSAEIGWLAQRGRVPLGYLGDEEKTRRTFPVIGGTRYSIPGDRARLLASGEVEVLGRDSATINSGGEKIFAEEVEAALKTHPAVYDVLVCGRPSAKWGQEVCAVVQLREGATPSIPELLAAAEPHLARYKLPKAIVFRDRIERSPAGKPDYKWAREQLA